MTGPWLSVIMPVYNGEHYLADALQSIVDQDDEDIECIVIDDGSTDRTQHILAEYAMALPIVQLRRERTGNWAANTNAALTAARGRYCCFLHQDDRWQTGRLREIRPLVERHPEVGLVLSRSIFIDTAGRPLGGWSCPLPPYPARVMPRQMLPRLLIQNFIAIPSPVFRTDMARDIGGLDDSLWYTADWDFWLKLAEHPAIYIPKVLAAFRIHAGSQTALGSRNGTDFKRQQELVLERHLGRLEGLVPDHRMVERVARFAVLTNTALASAYNREPVPLLPLLAGAARLGPLGLGRYLRDSRIVERVTARLRARMGLQAERAAGQRVAVS